MALSVGLLLLLIEYKNMCYHALNLYFEDIQDDLTHTFSETFHIATWMLRILKCRILCQSALCNVICY